MALSTAAKASLGGLGTVSVGGPTVYLVWGQYSSEQPVQEETVSLNEIEQEILKGDSPDWTVGDPDENVQGTVAAKVSKTVIKSDSASVTYKWECTITKGGEVNDVAKDKLVNYLKQKLNKDAANKQNSRRKLVEACSGEKTTENNSVKAKLTLIIKSYEASANTMTTDLLGSGTTTEVSG